MSIHLRGRNRRLFLAAVLLFMILPSAQATAQKIEWLRDFARAREKAYAEGKLILLFIEANLEDYSYRMNSETWNQPRIVALAKKFVSVKVDLQTWAVLRGQYERLIRRLRIEFVPVTLVVDPLGNQIYRGELFVPPKEMEERLARMPGDVKGVYAVLGQLEKDEGNVALTVAAGDAYHDINMPRVSNKYYDMVKDADTVKQNPLLAEHIEVNQALNLRAQGDLQKSIDMFERILDTYPRSPNRPMHLASLVRLYHQSLNDGQAEVYLSILRKEYPESRETAQAEALLKK